MPRWLPRSTYWRDISWLASGTLLAQLISLATLPMLTRLYAPEAFAASSVFLQALGLMSLLISFRFEYAVPLPKRQVNALALLCLVAGLSAAGSLVWTLAALALSPLLVSWTKSGPVGLWLLVPATAASASISVAVQLLSQRQSLYRKSGLAEVLAKAAYFSTALIGAWALPSPYGLLLALGAGFLAKAAYLADWRSQPSLFSVLRRRTLWWRMALRASRRYRSLSGSMLGSHLMLTCTGLIPTLFIASSFGADALGQWSLVQSTSYLPSALVGSAVGQVYFQRAAKEQAENRSYYGIWRATVIRLAIVGTPCFIFLAVSSRWLYPWLFGEAWTLSGELATVMSLSAFLAFLTTPLDRTCIVAGAWRYIPAWHAARLTTTALVVLAAHWGGWSLKTFVTVLTLQMVTMYLVDFVAERSFARNSPNRGR